MERYYFQKCILCVAILSVSWPVSVIGDTSISFSNELSFALDEINMINDKVTIVFSNLYPLKKSLQKVIEGNKTWDLKFKGNNSIFSLPSINLQDGKNYEIIVYDQRGSTELLLLKNDFKENVPKLEIEEAMLKINSKFTRELHVEGISDECYKCGMQPLAIVQPNTIVSIKVDTRWPFSMLIYKDSNISCRIDKHFVEHSVYLLSIEPGQNDSQMKCSVTVEYDATSKYIPIVVMVAVLIGLGILVYIVKYLFVRFSSNRKDDEMIQKDINDVEELNKITIDREQKEQTSRKRLRSLDTFRGIAIIIMIFVNYEGGKYWFFEHSIWNGLTVADLVFPWFIFIMGTSIALSTCSLRKKQIPKSVIFLKIVKRSIYLFLIGLFLNNVAVANLYLGPNEEDVIDPSYQIPIGRFDDITKYWSQWLLMIGILIIHILVTFLLHVPGCPTGYLGPGGIAEQGKYAHCVGGASGYIDREIFGNNHMYGHPTSNKIYVSSMPYDPEGLLGCLTSIFLTFLGLQAGRIVFFFKDHRSRLIRWLVWGVVLGCIALGLSGASQDDGVIPINKNLWSISFICATGSMAYILLAVCFFVIDVMRFWSGAPFYFAGMNAILLYVGHELLHNFFPFNLTWNPSTHASRLARSTMGTLVWMLIPFILYSKRIFWKI